MHQLGMFADDPAAPGAPRILKPAELALLCKLQRTWRGWSQETLAELSGLTVRTVQRVEAGQPVGLDTRRALAAAWEAPDIDCLNKPTVFPTVEEVRQQEKKRLEDLAANYFTVDMSRADGRGIARLLVDCEAVLVTLAEGLEEKAEVEDAFALVSDYVRDFLDIVQDVPATERLTCADELQRLIADLARHGVTLLAGKRAVPVRFAGGKNPRRDLTILYVLAAPKGKESAVVHVDKRVQLKF